MAGHHDRQRVAAVCGAHRAHRLRLPDAARQLAVADRLGVGNARQFLPHRQLERRALRMQRQVEPGPRAGEVFLQLLARERERRRRPQPVWRYRPRVSLGLEADLAQSLRIGQQQQSTDRARHLVDVDRFGVHGLLRFAVAAPPALRHRCITA